MPPNDGRSGEKRSRKPSFLGFTHICGTNHTTANSPCIARRSASAWQPSSRSCGPNCDSECIHRQRRRGSGSRKWCGGTFTAEVRVDPLVEWRQMYREVWREQRDFFYDPGHHGLNLEAAERKYEPYLEGVASRADLNYLL